MNEDRKKRLRWATRSMTQAQWEWVSFVGVLLFGLTGFIDVMDGLRFPTVKLIALVAVVAGLAWKLAVRRKQLRR